MIQQQQITGFVLAGGKSSRMGRDKGTTLLNGKQMIEYAIDALKPVCTNLVILANQDYYGSLGYPVYKDLVKDCGPLAGICTGLSATKTQLNVFVTCDAPFVSSSLLLFLVGEIRYYDAVVPIYGNKIYPLTAVYKKSCLPVFKESLAQRKLKVKEAIGLMNTKKVELTTELPFFNHKTLTNINTPKELQKNEYYT